METTAVQIAKHVIVGWTGLSKDALHIYVGLTVFLGVTLTTRSSLHHAKPWLAVLLVAVAGELVDMGDELIHLGTWRWAISLHDLLNTLLWPSLLSLAARCARLCGNGRQGV